MASSSSSLSRTWRYHVFASFHGPDVRKTFLSHLRKQFSSNGISMFNDQEIERSQTIGPALTQAIRESRISIVVLTKNYAASSGCLDELLEILKCREDFVQIVIPVFYEVDPSDVEKQTGDFGKVFKETCRHKTEEERQRWSQALTDVGNLGGYDSRNCDNEAEMIEKIATDVSNKLNINKPRGKSKSWRSTGMAFLVVINLLVEITAAVSEQLSSVHKPYFARISLAMSVLSVFLSSFNLTYKILAHKAGFRWHWMSIPWFYHPLGGFNEIFGSSTDIILFFCAVGQLAVSIITCVFIESGKEGPINVAVFPLFFAIGMVISKFMEMPTIDMVISKFMEKPAIRMVVSKFMEMPCTVISKFMKNPVISKFMENPAIRMVISKFMEKPVISEETLPLTIETQ